MPTDREALAAALHESATKRLWNYTPGVFRDRFVSPFDQYRDRVGQRFSIVRELSDAEART